MAALSSYIDNLSDCPKPLHCLDAFSSTGVVGLQWKQHFGSSVSVTLNDKYRANHSAILSHAQSNGFTVVDDITSVSEHDVQVTCYDANVLLHQQQFHFVHLDPFGCVAHYLDAVFTNVYSGGVVVATATDVASLYGVCPSPALRNYSARVVRTDFMKEMAARILISAMARSAARCNKGISVLYCAAEEHFIQVAVSVRRGAQQADCCLSCVHNVIVCSLCQSSTVYSNDGYCHNENPYKLLTCLCTAQNTGNTAVILGPIWCGDIFKADFISRMTSFAHRSNFSEQTLSLLRLIHGESTLGVVNGTATLYGQLSGKNQVCDESEASSCPDTADNLSPPVSKRLCITDERLNSEEQGLSGNKPNTKLSGITSVETGALSFSSVKNKESEDKSRAVITNRFSRGPMFYYCLHRRRLKTVDLPKASVLVELLKREGFEAAVTHFEARRGAVRTNASFTYIDKLISTHFRQKSSAPMLD